MRRFLVVLLCVVGGVAILVAGGLLIFWSVGVLGKPGVASNTVLEIDLERGMIEDVPDDPIASLLLEDTPRVVDVVLALQNASRDRRVKGLVARIGAGGFGMAVTQELRDAVATFRESGKFTIAWAETFGEVGPGNGGYYLATAFEEIWLQPSGDVGLTGLIYEHPFVRGTLDKLGIVARMDHRHEYKNAMNLFTEKEFTAAHREAMERLMGSQYGQIVRAIAEARGMAEAEVRGAVDRGPLLGEEAVEAKLVDRLGYRDAVYDRAREKAGARARFLYVDRYGERRKAARAARSAFALIYGVGAVTRGASSYDPLSGETTMGSDTVGRAFRAAAEDASVKAIIFRVDSPGGSYVASDTVWREVVRAQQAGKPVVVSMGNLAASGGYFVAIPADKIVAQPGTITGSIGVLGGKFLTRAMWEKIGLTWDEVHSAQNATMWSSAVDYNDVGWERFQAWLDRVYEDFTAKVAEGRELPLERVREIAKGRVWTGEDARDLGLVDELGGFPTAIRLAKEAAGIPEDQAVRLKIFPRKRTTFEQLFGESDESSGSRADARALVAALRELQPLARRLQPILAPAGERALALPPPEPLP